ncbi:CubicO group peptidase (beta-lactamase class C family) [Nocardiopsis sp. Huas11]|uniref:serine hydrolase domain-containing protein n=1 Tax=Nocardiopsis sp. Huas11 TaxID=2183912 RepID=UPI000F1B501B|nr:serine hydrolase domain-containing protein [Nocardiopsis sp. Huas11]RKS09169.1 CubicO group peptidase (beta-lactamase class C family) [Nocardiopsis sp. Huas11]
MRPAETTSASPTADGGGRLRGPRGPRPVAALAVVAAAAVIAASGAAPAAAATVPAPPTPVAATAELTGQDLDTWLDGLVPAALDSTGIPGAAVSVVHEGEVLTSRGYGYADTGADGTDPVPVDPEETLFRPGSVSKLFTATAVMRLVEEGELDLDTDVQEYLDFTVPTSFDEPLTLRHLLTHTAGFEERIDGLILPEDADADLRDHLVTDPPEQVYAPGTVPAYSNYGNALAGYVVELVGGLPFEEYVRTEVLDPLEMDSSTFVQPPPAALAERMAGGYPDDRAPAGPFEVVGGSPAGALTSSASDMTAFMLAHLGDAEHPLLDPATLELMHAPALTEESLGSLAEGPRMALGFFEEHRNGHRILGHGGDTNYFHSHLQIYPDDATGIFVTLNGGGYGEVDSLQLREAILFGFADRYFPAEGEESAPVQATAAEHAAMAEGSYESSRSMHSTFMNVLGALGGQTRVVAQEDGTILVTPGPETLTPTAYEEIEPWVWREVGGQRLLSMRVVDDQVEAIGFAGAFALLRTDAVRDASLALPVLVASATILLLTVLSWPVGTLLRRRFSLPRRERAGRTARVLTRVGVGAALAALLGWGLAFGEIMALRSVGAGALSVVLAAQWLGVAAVVPATVALIGDLRRGAGWRRCLADALVLAGLVGVAAFAAVFHLLSFDLTY